MILRNMVKDSHFYKRISKIGLKKRWDIEHSKVRIIKKISKEKIAINAYLCGDGWISIRIDKYQNKHYEIKIFLDDLSLAKYVVSLFEKEFNISPKIVFHQGCFNIQIKNKPACLNLLSLGEYSTNNWKIPKNLSKSYIMEWIRCFFDCEAHVNVNKKLIQVKSVNFNGLSEINERLNLLGINSVLYGPYQPKNRNHKRYGMIFITGKENLRLYQRLINFYHPKKKEGLNQIVL